MKKKITVVIAALAIALGGTAIAFAQAAPGAGGSPAPAAGPFDWANVPGAKAVPLEGTLTFVDGNPALVAGGKTYLLMIPDFYRLAYTGGIKEGAKLKLEGYALPARTGALRPELVRYAVTKLNANGADVAIPAFGGRGAGRGMMGYGGDRGYGPGMMGDGRGYGMMGGRGGRW